MRLRGTIKPPPLAIDVGAGGVHALQLERRGSAMVVRHWSYQPIRDAACDRAGAGHQASDDRPAFDRPAVEPNLPPLNRERFVGNEVVLSIGPPDLECTPLRVPDNLLAMDHAALLAAIRHEVGRSISMPLEQVEMDAWRLVPGHLDCPNVMVAAARREAVGRVLRWLDAQGLVCRRIDASPLAAVRACGWLPDWPTDDRLWGVLDIGRSAARVYIGIGQVPVYVRCVPRGGAEMSRRISEELNVDPKTAESYKRHYGIHNGDGHYRPATAGVSAVDAQRMAGILLGILRPVVRGIAEEVQRSFRYAMGLYPDREISGVCLVGGGANLPGLCETLGDTLGVGVHRLSAESLSSTVALPAGFPDEMAPSLAVCLGLGLGEVTRAVS